MKSKYALATTMPAAQKKSQDVNFLRIVVVISSVARIARINDMKKRLYCCCALSLGHCLASQHGKSNSYYCPCHSCCNFFKSCHFGWIIKRDSFILSYCSPNRLLNPAPRFRLQDHIDLEFQVGAELEPAADLHLAFQRGRFEQAGQMQGGPATNAIYLS